MVLGKLDSHIKRMELYHYFTLYTNRLNSKWIKNLNVRPETIKLLEENIDVKFFDIGFSSEFFNLTPKEAKAKISGATSD